MVKRHLVPALAAISVGWSVAAHAQQPLSPQLDGAQIEAIEDVVRNYLLSHPEILRDAARILEQRERAAAVERQRQAIAAHSADLVDDPDTPVMGNPDGDVTVVEFFDYRCPYCRGVVDDLLQEIEVDGGIRLVMKELPVLGPASVEAARAALAAAQQGQYDALHVALMRAPGGLDKRTILSVARETGLDVPQLRQDMASPAIEAMVERNLALAQSLSVTGTPTFIVGDILVPGALSIEQLRVLVAEARQRAAHGGNGTSANPSAQE